MTRGPRSGRVWAARPGAPGPERLRGERRADSGPVREAARGRVNGSGAPCQCRARRPPARLPRAHPSHPTRDRPAPQINHPALRQGSAAGRVPIRHAPAAPGPGHPGRPAAGPAWTPSHGRLRRRAGSDLTHGHGPGSDGTRAGAFKLSSALRGYSGESSSGPCGHKLNRRRAGPGCQCAASGPGGHRHGDRRWAKSGPRARRVRDSVSDSGGLGPSDSDSGSDSASPRRTPSRTQSRTRTPSPVQAWPGPRGPRLPVTVAGPRARSEKTGSAHNRDALPRMPP